MNATKVITGEDVASALGKERFEALQEQSKNSFPRLGQAMSVALSQGLAAHPDHKGRAIALAAMRFVQLCGSKPTDADRERYEKAIGAEPKKAKPAQDTKKRKPKAKPAERDSKEEPPAEKVDEESKD